MFRRGPERSLRRRTRGPVVAFAAAVASLTLALSLPQAEARGGRERLDRVERAVIRLVNQRRARAGLPRVRRSRALNRAADAHSREMARRRFFAHSSANGASATARVRRFRRARRTGETIAWTSARGGRKARRVVRMWMASPGHRAALMTRAFRRVGVARRTGRWGGGRVAVFTLDLQSRR